MSKIYTTAGISPESQDKLKEVKDIVPFLEKYLEDHGVPPYKKLVPLFYELYFDMFFLGVYWFSSNLCEYIGPESNGGITILAAMNEIIEKVKDSSKNVH